MKTKKLHSGFELPELGLGTWPMGGFRHKDPSCDEKRDIKAIRYALDNGITHFDTAELYGTGAAEKILGEAIKGYDREKLQIASKVKGSNCSYEAIKIACKKSLERLEVDYLDLYYIHWRDERFDLEDCMRAMDELKEEGLIKHIGVSNFSTKSLKEAQSFTKNKIVANQVHYNLIYRECCAEQGGEESLLEYCQNNDVMLVSWRPVELGKLANFGGETVTKISELRDKTHAQIAINFLTYQQNVVTIFKSSNLEHIDENLGGAGWELKQDEFDALYNDTAKVVYESDGVPLS